MKNGFFVAENAGAGKELCSSTASGTSVNVNGFTATKSGRYP